MSACLALEQTLRVAYLGPPGTFSHEAVAKHFGHFVDMPCRARRSTRSSARRRAAQTDHAVVPVENSTEGAVGRTLDLMFQTPLTICGEIRLRIRQNLLSTAATIGEVDARLFARAVARPMRALARPPSARGGARRGGEQCRGGSPRGERNRRRRRSPARTPRRSTGLRVLAPHIEDVPNNTTRFWVLGRNRVPPSGHDETSLVMSAPNRPGAMHSLLEPFATHGVSMTRLESRPARTGLWEYLFYVDLVGHETDAAMAAALAELAKKAPMIKILGSYPAAVY